MKVRRPEYYDRFRCIAGACSDSCCIGWEIDIDEEKEALYRKVPGALGQRMKRCIDWEEGHFILQGKEERCPFLNQENLCDLILELGEESLCDICREHPRFYDWFDSLTEAGLGLCCEAAGRLVLAQEEPVRFVTEACPEPEDGAEAGETETGEAEAREAETGEAEARETKNGEAEIEEVESGDVEAELLNILFFARDTAFAILQNREISIWDRLRRFMDYAEELQEMLEFGILEEIQETAAYYRENPADEPEKPEMSADVYSGILKLCRALEPIDESWPEKLSDLEALAAQPELLKETKEALSKAVKDRDYEYEHLAVYFVYRYFMKCRFDGDVRAKAALVLFCLYLIHLLDVETFRQNGSLSKEDRVQNAKLCSKEIEYSEENLDLLAETL